MRKRILIHLGFCLALMGCNEDDAPPPTAEALKSPQTLPSDLHDFKVPQEAPKPEEIPAVDVTPIASVKLPSNEALIWSREAKRLRGEREFNHYAAQMKLKSEDAGAEEERVIVKTQDDYRPQGLEPNESSYPVDRSRMITEDMRIPAILEDSINSQIPGRAIAVINRDVYSANGKFVVLPAYSKIICAYESLEKQGQTRLALKCRRIIRPDGVSITLIDAQAADQMGRNGLVGKIDYRLWQRYGGAFLVAGISAIAQAGSGMTRSRAVDQGATNLSQNLGQVTSQFLEEAIDIKPVITIAAGSRIQIIPQNDILLKKPKIVKKRKRL